MAAAIAYSVGGLQLASSANATQYLTTPATTGDVTDSVAATGTIASTDGLRPRLRGGAGPDDRLERRPPGSGTWTVTDVSAKVGHGRQEGRRPREGVDRRPPAPAAQRRRPRSASARLQEKQAKQALKDASGTDAIRQAKVDRYNAVNARRDAQQSVDDLKTRSRYATLTAPIDGIVTAVNIGKGLDSTGTAISIAASTYEVTADVVESDISSMSVGQDATIGVDAIGATIAGTVSAIAPTAARAAARAASSPTR